MELLIDLFDLDSATVGDHTQQTCPDVPDVVVGTQKPDVALDSLSGVGIPSGRVSACLSGITSTKK